MIHQAAKMHDSLKLPRGASMMNWQKLIATIGILSITGCGSGMNAVSNPALSPTSGNSNPVSSVDPTQLHQATSASSFTDSVGLNTHFSYTDTAYYQSTAQVIQAIQQLQVRHIRDGLHSPAAAPNIYTIEGQLNQAGIHADLIVPNPGSNGPTLAQMQVLLANSPAAENIEAPNEYDESGNSNWVSDLHAYLPTVLALGHDAGLQVYGPSLTQINSYPAVGNIANFMDFNNYHAYWGGRNPENGGWGGPDAENNYYGSLSYDLDELQMDCPGVPSVITETGYVANGTVGSASTIPESVEAIYEPRLLLHSWNLGIKRTYIYELLDEPSSTNGFGLLHSDLTPRPAFNAIASLMGLVAENAPNFVSGKLGYTLTGNTSGVETTLLQKSDGSFWLALWLPASVFDVNAVTPISVPTQNVNLSVLGGAIVRSEWTFDGTGKASLTSVNSATANLEIGSGVTMLKIQ
jgi:hypothetical protein